MSAASARPLPPPPLPFSYPSRRPSSLVQRHAAEEERLGRERSVEAVVVRDAGNAGSREAAHRPAERPLDERPGLERVVEPVVLFRIVHLLRDVVGESEIDADAGP